MGRKTIITHLKEFKHRVHPDFPVDRMLLFGSRAGGKPHRDSDIDLIIVSKKFKGVGFMQRATKMYKYWKIRYPVDFFCLTPQEFNKRKNMITIVREAVREGIRI